MPERDIADFDAKRGLEVRLAVLEAKFEDLNMTAFRTTTYVTLEKWETRHRELETEVNKLVVWKSRVVGIAIGWGSAGGFITFLLTKLLSKL